VATGKLVRQRPIVVRNADADLRYSITLSPDGELFAYGDKESVMLCDATTGKERHRFAVPSAEKAQCLFAPSGKVLAIFSRGENEYRQVRFWDTATGKERGALELDQPITAWSSSAFSGDGKLLAILDHGGGKAALYLWDVDTGKKLGQTEAGGWSLAISADGKLIATAGVGGGALWETDTMKEAGKLPLLGRESAEALKFSPDGKWLVGVSQHANGIIWNMAERKEESRLVAWGMGDLAFSPDGKTFATWGWSSSDIQLWDVTTGKRLNDRPGHGHHVHALAVSPDGKIVASGALHDPVLRLWDAATGKPLYQLKTPDSYVNTCVFSADGKAVLSGGNNGTIQMWDAATGKELRRFVFENPPNWMGLGVMVVQAAHLSPDGKRLAAYAVHTLGDTPSAILRLWDAGSAERLLHRSFRLDAHSRANPNGGRQSTYRPHSRFTPDGKAVTVRTDKGLALEETATGREILTIAGNLGSPLGISSDGWFLAASRYKPFDDPFHGYEVQAVTLAEAATGQEVLQINTGQIRHLEFAPDSRFLATADAEGVRLWDMAAGKAIFHRQWSEEYRTKFAGGCPAGSFGFALGGRAIVTGMTDGTLLVWDVSPATKDAQDKRDLSRKELEQLWADLAANATQAHRAIYALAAAPASSVPFLKESVKPADALDDKRIERLIKQLDSDQFAARDSAMKELMEMRDEIGPALQRALDNAPSVETTRRIKAILGAPPSAPTGETLRGLRAIKALERIAAPEARQLLQKLADGASSSRLTREAKAALKRLQS
jgi:WD40 repeat protein